MSNNPFELLNTKIRDADDKFTKREIIAAQLLQGLLSNSNTINSAPLLDLARHAIKNADILLQELRTKPAGALK